MIHETRNIASDMAWKLASLARDHAAESGWLVAVVVTDVQGCPLSALRMDGVAPPVLDFAGDKAYTAATMRRSTAAWFERMNASPGLRTGLANRSRLLVWGGGLPVVLEGQVIGGIGVSGAAEPEDIACARTALEALGLFSEL